MQRTYDIAPLASLPCVSIVRSRLPIHFVDSRMSPTLAGVRPLLPLVLVVVTRMWRRTCDIAPLAAVP